MAPEFGCRCRQRRRHLREESALLEDKYSPSHPSTSQSVPSTSTLRIESNNNNNNISCCWPSDVVIRCNLKRINVLDRDGNFARLESHNFEQVLIRLINNLGYKNIILAEVALQKERICDRRWQKCCQIETKATDNDSNSE